MSACSSDPAPSRTGDSAKPTTAPLAPVLELPKSGRMPGEVPFRPPGTAAPPICSNPNLVYYGGPVLQSVLIYEVSWTANVNSALTTNLPNFYGDITNSSYWDWLTEYDTVGLTPGTNQAILRGSFGGAFTITPSVCNTTGSCNLTDAQIQSELQAQITAGSLPQPMADCAGQTKSIYMIDFPSNISIRDPNNNRSCQAGGFCAYHYTTTLNGTAVPYGVLPDVFTGGCSVGCGTAATALDNATSVHSHELVEATTDADVGLATTTAAPLGWYDSRCGEIGDICNGNEQSITVGARTWTVQQEWSDKQRACVVSGSPLPICTGTTRPPACRLCSCGDNGAACNGATPWCETSSTNIDYGGCEQCTQNSQCTSGTCTKSSNPATDDTCATVACGATGQPCCAGNMCVAGDVCVGGTCAACGGAGQPCCTGGACNPPNTCGGGGMPGVCGCTPATCQPGQCGSLPDGCGGSLNCGSCTPPQSCGGGGAPNQCGCTPVTCAQFGCNCGPVSDGCGNLQNCGSCTAPQTCGGGGTACNCGCTPTVTCQSLGDNCGTITDDCGNMQNCGSCAPPQSCGGGGTPNHCGCTPTVTCQSLGDNCGTITDDCGNVQNCGSCPSGQSCVMNQCVAQGMDSGIVDSGGGMDSGSVQDSGTPQDSGTAADSGTASDSGAASDSGTASDSGSRTDSGVAMDSGARDSGGVRDSGSGNPDAALVDTGTFVGIDGGSDSPNADTGGGGGCGCRTAPSRTPSSMGMASLVGLALLVARRRKRS